jgi:hypothetical protein
MTIKHISTPVGKAHEWIKKRFIEPGETMNKNEPCVPVSTLRTLLTKAAGEYNYLYAHAVLRDGIAALCDAAGKSDNSKKLSPSDILHEID